MNIKFEYRPHRQYPWHWYYSPQGDEFREVYEWLWKTFGEIDKRWSSHGGWIMLGSEEDAVLFTLRWS